jgi:hypothetical protein
LKRLIIVVTLLLIATISAGLTMQIQRIPMNLSMGNQITSQALSYLINVDNQTRSRLLTKEGALIVSTDNLNGIALPSSLDGIRLEVLTPEQIRAKADTKGFISYIRIQRIEWVDYRHVNVVLSSYEAKGQFTQYPRFGYWMNATALFTWKQEGWVMRGLDYDLCAVDRVTGVGTMIQNALVTAAN